VPVMAQVAVRPNAAVKPPTAVMDDRSVMANGTASGVLLNGAATDTASAPSASAAAVRIRIYIPDVNYRVHASCSRSCLWSPYVISSFFIPRLISAATDWMSTILLHMTWP